jgi:hypothetical protein
MKSELNGVCYIFVFGCRPVVKHLTNPMELVLREKPPLAQLLIRISQYFTESEGSLLCSYKHSTGSCPEPDESMSCHPTLSNLTSIFLSVGRLSKESAEVGDLV